MENKLLFNFLLDLKKEVMFDKFERASIIKKYLEDNKLSQRELGRELGIPHSTIQDWCMWSKIDRKRHDDMIELGYNERDIYRALRNNKNQEILPIENIRKEVKTLKEFDSFLRSNTKKLPDNIEIRDLLQNIKNNINRIEMYYDKRNKR